MFIIKKNYYFYIDKTETINLDLIIIPEKITFIYRSNYKKESLNKIINFAKICRTKKIKLFIAREIFFPFVEKISAHISGEDDTSLKNSPRPPPEKSARSS